MGSGDLLGNAQAGQHAQRDLGRGDDGLPGRLVDQVNGRFGERAGHAVSSKRWPGRPNQQPLAATLNIETGDLHVAARLHLRTGRKVHHPAAGDRIALICFDERDPGDPAHAADQRGVLTGIQGDQQRRIPAAARPRERPGFGKGRFERGDAGRVVAPIVVGRDGLAGGLRDQVQLRIAENSGDAVTRERRPGSPQQHLL